MRAASMLAIVALFNGGCYTTIFTPGTPGTPAVQPVAAHWEKFDETRGSADQADDDYVCQKEVAKTAEYGGSAPSHAACMKHRGWQRVAATQGTDATPGSPPIEIRNVDVGRTALAIVIGAVATIVVVVIAVLVGRSGSTCYDAFTCPR